MKNRTNVIVLSVLVIMAGLVWIVARNQRNTIKTEAAVPLGSVETVQPPKIQVLVLPSQVAEQPPAKKVEDAAPKGETKHIAQAGETVTSLATDLLGKDSKTNRDAIINANSSLKADPDNLVAGKSYRIPQATEIPVTEVTPASPKIKPEVVEVVPAQPAKELKYTAAPGDTVTHMAGAFLGSGDKTNQDAIVNANSSLRADPDHVVAGKAYRIPVPNGLSASATPSVAETSPRPTTQPDADQVVLAGSPRTLRYTAHSGDTVTTLAIELLGSDTQEARNSIINNNPSLKQDPDRVIAGQTYWIPAPIASIQNP